MKIKIPDKSIRALCYFHCFQEAIVFVGMWFIDENTNILRGLCEALVWDIFSQERVKFTRSKQIIMLLENGQNRLHHGQSLYEAQTMHHQRWYWDIMRFHTLSSTSWKKYPQGSIKPKGCLGDWWDRNILALYFSWKPDCDLLSWKEQRRNTNALLITGKLHITISMQYCWSNVWKWVHWIYSLPDLV